MSESERISLYELLERSAVRGIDLQRGDGSFPPGRNGPYRDNTTAIRNTANWLKILSCIYHRTGNDHLRSAANSAVEYITRHEHRPHGYTYQCRKSPNKDSCNGLVGQANVIEAMGRASKYLDRPKLLDIPTELYEIHPFNERTGVWNRVEIDGTKLSIDRTFNHQLIFAAASSLLVNRDINPKIRSDINSFLDNLSRNMDWDASGTVIHRLRPKIGIGDIWAILQDRCFELFVNPVLHTKQKILPDNKRKKKELGYHSVNLYWLANLKKRVPEHNVWSYIPIDALLDVTRTNRYRSFAKKSNGWFGSIPPGFQIAHAINAFEDAPNENELEYWISMALANHYDKEVDLFINNCSDEETLSGLLYQLLDLPDLTVEF